MPNSELIPGCGGRGAAGLRTTRFRAGIRCENGTRPAIRLAGCRTEPALHRVATIEKRDLPLSVISSGGCCLGLAGLDAQKVVVAAAGKMEVLI